MSALCYRIDVLNHLSKYGVVPTIDGKSTEEILSIAEAIIEGGIKTIEICFRDDGIRIPIETLSAIYRLRKKYSHKDVAVGCGTVHTAEHAQSAIDHGAQFVVSNVTDERIIEVAHANATLVIPGARTDTDVHLAMRKGCLIVKLLMPFPVNQTPDNLRYLGQYFTLFPKMMFTATMGITPENLPLFLKAGCPFVASGKMVSKEAVINCDWATITEETKKFSEAMRDYTDSALL